MRLLLLFFLCVLAFSQLQAAKPPKPVFNGEVGKVLLQKCGNCHREGGGAPFELLRYEQFAKRKKFVAEVVASGYMPPWTADPHYRSFADQKALTPAEKQLILDWVAAGAPRGKRNSEPKIPNYTQNNGLGEPDVILKMAEPYTVPGTGQHHYICYKIPYELPGDAFVKAIEYVPGNKSLVHHASYQFFGVGQGVDVFKGPTYYAYNADSADRVDDNRDFGFFGLYDSLGQPPFTVFHSGYLPGTSVQQYPEGIGFALPRKGVLLIRSLHYSPTPIPRNDQSAVRLWLSEKPLDRRIELAAFRPKIAGDTIEANVVKSYYINIKTSGDMSLLHINPHMHQLGKSFLAYALTPQGDTIPLVRIPRWDFNWQEFYRFEHPVLIPSGSIIHAEGVYDNTEANVANPNSPPKPMLIETGSMDDTTEMMRLLFLYVPYRAGDEAMRLE